MRKQIVRIFYNLRGKAEEFSAQAGKSAEQAEGLAAGEIDARSGADAEQMLSEAESGVERNGTADASGRLLERKAFEKFVDEDLRAGGMTGCLLVGDVDRFRKINDIYGQDTGDAVLRHVVKALLDAFADCACIAGQGSDIFTLWLSGVSPEQEELLRRQAGAVNDRLLHPVEGLPPVTLSVGMAFSGAGEDCRSLGRKAVKALNLVKESGRCGCEVFDSNKI